MAIKNNKGQAVIEMAILGLFVLFVFGILLSFGQMLNDQQYVQMETFRTALQRACAPTGPIPLPTGAGASVDMTLIQTRRQADLSDNFRMGRPTTVSSSASVYWSVPPVGEQGLNLSMIKINEDEPLVDNILNSLPMPSISLPILGETSVGLTMKNIASETVTDFTDISSKQEDREKIATTRASGLREKITTTIRYTIMPSIPGLDPNVGPTLFEHPIEQNLYVEKGSDGHYKYKYSQSAPYEYINRARTWETKF